MPTCFIAMPLTTRLSDVPGYGGDVDHFVHVLEHLFVPAVEAAGYEPRKPIMSGADLIHAEIVRHLEESDMVLCDLSQHNPNVFFELGIRTALDRPIALVRDSQTDTLPFDTSGVNTHTYDASIAPWVLSREVESLAEHIRASAERSDKRNPLWRYFGLTKSAVASPNEDPTSAKLDLLLDRVHHLEGRVESAKFDSAGVLGLPRMAARVSPPSRQTATKEGTDRFDAVLDQMQLLGDELGIDGWNLVEASMHPRRATFIYADGHLDSSALRAVLNYAESTGFRIDVVSEHEYVYKKP